MNRYLDFSQSNALRLWRLIGKNRKRQVRLLVLLLIASVLMETATLAMVIPLVNSLANPDSISGILREILLYFGGETAERIRLILTALFVVFVLISALIRLSYLSASLRLSFSIGADLTEIAFRRTMALPYEEQTRLNSSSMLTGLMVKMQAIVFSGMVPMLSAFGASILGLTIIVTLFAITPRVTLVLVVLLFSLITLIVLVLRVPLKRTGEQIASLQPKFTEQLQVARGGIREIILDGTQEYFAQELSRVQRELRFNQAKGAFLSSSPRFLMETVFLLLILGLALWTFGNAEDPVAAIPSLSIIALGAMKILPSAQLLVLNWATIRNGEAGVRDGLDLVELGSEQSEYASVPTGEHRILAFDQEIRLIDVCFRYRSDEPWILQGINLTIKKGDRVGLIGQTGAGKSTLIDLIMGLLTPTSGRIEVDGLTLDELSLFSWRRRVAHVPQSIFLIDTSVAENIAFGVPQDKIQRRRIVDAANMASIATFVDDGAAGFATLVGERGARISGGQRQRIGIARALYKSADLIVLDEATSALDGETETRIMQTIADLGKEKTVLIIAHRLTTLKDCDWIVELERGSVKRVCNYDSLSIIEQSDND